MNPENEAKKAYLDLQNENTMLRGEIGEQAEEIKNREDGIDSLIFMKKRDQIENNNLRTSLNIAETEIKKLEAALASCNPHLPFWVGEAPLNPGPRGSRYAIFNAHETWFIVGDDPFRKMSREDALGLCHTICSMLNRAWSMARGKGMD